MSCSIVSVWGTLSFDAPGAPDLPDPALQVLDGVQHVPRERVQNLVGKQIVDVPVSKILVAIVVLRERATEYTLMDQRSLASSCPTPRRTGSRKTLSWK